MTSFPKGRALARGRGYLNYCGGFAGKVGPVINTYLSLVINIDRLGFKLYHPKQADVWYTVASEYQLGAVHGRSKRDVSIAAATESILFNEAAASILPTLLTDHPTGLHLYIDNMAVIGL
ncbi:hypothetical protein BpHYR1_052515 [Brachionus plicatilis]|uniref:Uncharacterized protein n=1 Tax=Brachionus plicatilis TaxID=10195 RepID=A0A3M7QRY8_BRAPC|nr:hypothetical protein BpHYR1_052515 [Brachionus plicatilis]